MGSCQHTVIAQGAGITVRRLWVISHLYVCYGEEFNHLAAAASSSSLCFEMRPRNKATSIIKEFSWDRDHSHNSVRTTFSPLMFASVTSHGHSLNYTPKSILSLFYLSLLICLSHESNISDPFPFMSQPHSPPHLAFLHISFPPFSRPSLSFISSASRLTPSTPSACD